jgi:outer membrane protein TolC
MVPVSLDVDAAVRNAIDTRGDLITARRQLDNTLIDVRYYKNQRMPALDLNVTYGLVGLGGTQFEYGSGFPPPVIGQSERGFGSVLGDVFGNDYKSWSVGFQLSYPLGMSVADASLAQARLQQVQAETNLRSMEMLVTTSVRDVARQVTTNQKRVEATQKARELAERRLEAEQKKFNVGLSTTFVVFQLQRDVASQRAREVAAIIDYNKSLVDFEAVQQAPIR